MAELSAAQLRRSFDPEVLHFETTADLSDVSGIIGQERALRSLEFGLGIAEAGYNVFVAGPPGTGRTTAVKGFLEDFAARQPVPPDWCYVANLGDPYRPRAFSLPAGRGRELKRDIAALVEAVRREGLQVFESDQYGERREKLGRAVQARRDELLAELDARVRQAGFLLQASPAGLLLVPTRGGQPISEQEFLALDAPARDRLRERQAALDNDVAAAMKGLRALDKQSRQQLEQLSREMVASAVGGLFDDMAEKFHGLAEVRAYLAELQADMVGNIEGLREDGAATARRYQVNVVVDNSGRRGAPVVIESNPTYSNLIGRIEKEGQMGVLSTDHTLIRAGSLLQASGGYLVIPVEDLLRNPFAYDGLKRALRDRAVEMEDVGDRLGFLTAKTLRPMAIPLQIKVILIGNPLLYQLLGAYDEQFGELFKVKAEFDSRMDGGPANLPDYLAWICQLCRREPLRHLDRGAVARVLEFSGRLAEQQDKLSTRFAEIADLLREASFWAGRDGADVVGAHHVEQAEAEKVYRVSLVRDRIQEWIRDGVFHIAVDGRAVGQVNGLAVVSLGGFAFGRPSRITASVGMGREGVMDIEREAELGGPIHTKGVLILGGYLVERYAREFPLAVSARLVFEQSYEGIEGDSASSTELYALLSALAELPVDQGLAVTGSVNQKGEVQAIGGVNEKIEGFFDVCRLTGLTGRQGVLVPRDNARNLMLRRDVVQAVRDGVFHVHAVATVDEGLELLTGRPAAEVHALVQQRLRALADGLRSFRPR